MTTKTCKRCERTKPVSHFVKRARRTNSYLARCRPCENIRKKEAAARAAATGRPTEPADSISRVRIDVERLHPHLAKWCDRNAISQQSLATTRRVYAVLNEQSVLQFDTADRLLIELGLDWLWHTPRSEGGLADIYEREDAHGSALAFSGLGGPADSSVLDGGEGTNSLEEAA